MLIVMQQLGGTTGMRVMQGFAACRLCLGFFLQRLYARHLPPVLLDLDKQTLKCSSLALQARSSIAATYGALRSLLRYEFVICVLFVACAPLSHALAVYAVPMCMGCLLFAMRMVESSLSALAQLEAPLALGATSLLDVLELSSSVSFKGKRSGILT